MNDSTRPAEKTRPRFAVRNKPAKRNPGPCWTIVDRLERKVVRRFVYKASADQVVRELNEKADPIPASARNPRDSWPSWTDSGRWTLVSPEVPPAEERPAEEPSPEDRRWWAAESEGDGQGDDHGPLLADVSDPMLNAYHDRLEAEFFARVEMQDLIEFAR